MMALFAFALAVCMVCASAAPVVHVWNNRTISPIDTLALIPGREFPHTDFDPPLNVRGDGSLFLSVTVVDSADWINIALNSFVSLAKYQNSSGLTIMTMNDERLGSIFRKLDLFTYDAKPIIATFPPDFRLERPLPSWSWGAIIFLRFNAWFEAFRRGIGFCSIDTDVTYTRDVFFVRDSHNDQFADIATQGDLEVATPKAGNACGYKWTQKFSHKLGYYVNPGLSCHAYNERTLKFMQDFQTHIAITIKKQLQGWGQPAYQKHFCEQEFHYDSATPTDHRWHWHGHLRTHNVSVSMFKALPPLDPNYAEDSEVRPGERPLIASYHAKACHGVDKGDALARVKCKEDWLKEQGQWFLPEDLPRGLDAWLAVDDATIAKLKALLHNYNN